MIGRLCGKILQCAADAVILDVGGVGYEVHLPRQAAAALPQGTEPVALLIHTHVREDRIQLIGFLELLDKKVFEMLLSVSGIGIKLALAILSEIPAEGVLAAIAREDDAKLSSVSGVGRKTAQRIVLELKEKAAKEWQGQAAAAMAGLGTGMRRDLASALANLGYRKGEIEAAIGQLPGEAWGEFETALRAALRLLAGANGNGARP